MTSVNPPVTPKPSRPQERVVIRFAGDSGDGMQLTGDRFTQDTAMLGNDLATLPNFPAEIRAPQGTLPGVSSFQVQFASTEVFTPGVECDVLIAMNPAAFLTNIKQLRPGGVLIADVDEFTTRNFKKVGLTENPLDDPDLAKRVQVHQLPLTSMTVEAVKDSDLTRKEAERAKNMFALGLVSWLYSRSMDSTKTFLERKFAKKPAILEANLTALNAGWAYGETTETFAHQYEVAPAESKPGTYRNITGNIALSYGLVAAAHKADLQLVLGSYPITPASDILHTLADLKRFGVTTIQAEDEIAAVGIAIGASFGGKLGVTTTSGPGLALKMEAIGLAVSLELPLVVVDVQRGGPSTGLPTKTEQADLLQAVHGRNGEAPLPVVAASSPTHCFDAAVEAVRIAVKYRTPVILLSVGYAANGSEPWLIPSVDSLPTIDPNFATGPNYTKDGERIFAPYARDPETLARPWAPPGITGIAHRIGGIEKTNITGDISYDPDNHQLMTELRQAKIDGVDVPDVEVDDAEGDAEVLIVGWGSTFGPVAAAVRRARERGTKVAHCHLTHLSPFHKNLGDVLAKYPKVLVPEMNSGQLRTLLRAKYLVDAKGFNQVRGLPFSPAELSEAIVACTKEDA